ncbi:MAG: hypothetical protein GTO46_09515 [Gemmatimonadetes bacterium]|nr:hypothetical protein [Gemmatimonadota bacterium]NIO31853.1 hypothetical protein [Gemmatimonadota bacterium]
MMKGARLGFALLALAVTPVTASAQWGATRLLTGPDALGQRQMEVRGYISIAEEINVFGVYRRGVGGNIDFGLRAGYTGYADGGFHLGGDLRYELPVSGTQLQFALAGGVQASFMDLANVIAVPFGVSIGADVSSGPRSVIVYALPFLEFVRIDPDGPGSDTEFEGGVELGSEVEIVPGWIGNAVLSISSHNDDEVQLALGVIWRR